MWKFLLPFAAFIALAVLFAFGLNPNRDIHALPSPLIGKQAPLFSLTEVSDPSRVVSNAAYKGQVYVLNVWGTWCGACRQEHEALLGDFAAAGRADHRTRLHGRARQSAAMVGTIG